MKRPETTIDLSAVNLTVEFVLGEIVKRTPDWARTVEKIREAAKQDHNGVTFQLLTLMRSLGFVAQDLLTAKGDALGAANVGALLLFLQGAFEKELSQVTPVELIEE